MTAEVLPGPGAIIESSATETIFALPEALQT